MQFLTFTQPAYRACFYLGNFVNLFSYTAVLVFG